MKTNDCIILAILLSLFLCGCQGASNSGVETPTGHTTDQTHWRYFDRELYFPIGASVAPEVAASQFIIQSALEELARRSDLGVDYFIFKEDEDSILQPVVDETSYQGRNWRSFYQIWTDEKFNDYTAQNLGSTGDEDVIVALNAKNNQEYFIIARASCFAAGEACGIPNQSQAEALVWRSFGYLIGLRHSENANSPIMQPGMFPEQESEESQRLFIAELNGQLERIRNKLPLPE